MRKGVGLFYFEGAKVFLLKIVHNHAGMMMKGVVAVRKCPKLTKRPVFCFACRYHGNKVPY